MYDHSHTPNQHFTALEQRLSEKFASAEVTSISGNHGTIHGGAFELHLYLPPDDSELRILLLNVPRHLRCTGLGIGESVVDVLKQYAHEQGLRLLACQVDTRSQGFWTHERLGFQPQPYCHKTYIFM